MRRYLVDTTIISAYFCTGMAHLGRRPRVYSVPDASVSCTRRTCVSISTGVGCSPATYSNRVDAGRGLVVGMMITWRRAERVRPVASPSGPDDVTVPERLAAWVERLEAAFRRQWQPEADFDRTLRRAESLVRAEMLAAAALDPAARLTKDDWARVRGFARRQLRSRSM